MKKFSPAIVIVPVSLLAAGLAFARAPRMPVGSYQQTCTNIAFDGRMLSATCQNANGRRVRTSLGRADLCRRDIANINGTLTCR